MMYFYKHKGRQCLDLTGNLILTHNAALVMGRTKSAAPSGVIKHAKSIPLRELGFFGKVKAVIRVARFIFSKPPTLPEIVSDVSGG